MVRRFLAFLSIQSPKERERRVPQNCSRMRDNDRKAEEKKYPITLELPTSMFVVAWEFGNFPKSPFLREKSLMLNSQERPMCIGWKSAVSRNQCVLEGKNNFDHHSIPNFCNSNGRINHEEYFSSSNYSDIITCMERNCPCELLHTISHNPSRQVSDSWRWSFQFLPGKIHLKTIFPGKLSWD